MDANQSFSATCAFRMWVDHVQVVDEVKHFENPDAWDQLLPVLAQEHLAKVIPDKQYLVEIELLVIDGVPQTNEDRFLRIGSDPDDMIEPILLEPGTPADQIPHPWNRDRL